MSYKDRLSDLDRANERSLTQQLVDLSRRRSTRASSAPASSCRQPASSPSSAGVNHLTAVRAYRRLRELGLVSSQVGRGTFVRGAGRRSASAVGGLDRLAAYALRRRRGATATACSPRSTAATARAVPLSVGYPSERIFPTTGAGRLDEAVLRERAGKAMQYSDVQGVPELASEIAELSAQRGVPRTRRTSCDQRRHPGPEPGEPRDPPAG